MISGLMGQTKAPRMEVVKFGANKGRGVVAMEAIKRGHLCVNIKRTECILEVLLRRINSQQNM